MPPVTTTPTVTINGTRHEFPQGLSVLDALRSVGDDVPNLCLDDRIKPAGACRMCIVKIEGQPRPVTACTVMLEHGMVIETRTAELKSLRRTNLSLIAAQYPASAVTAEPEHPFHRLLAEYEVTPGGGRGPEPYHDETHPYLQLEMDRCINCYRCVRICEEVQAADVWQIWGRGPDTQVAPRGKKSLLEAGCVSCGACSDTCPTGAILDRREKPAEKWTRTTCVYCGVGCQMNVGTADGNVVAVRPVHAPVNLGHLCSKGRYAFEFNNAPDRITTPMIRDTSGSGQWRECTWDEALDETASRLKSILSRFRGWTRRHRHAWVCARDE